MKTVIIDNYDSFTYNLSHLVKELGAEVTVLRNDAFQLEELEKFDKIILLSVWPVPWLVWQKKR
jgi:anthranilate synthase component II